jgi:hypothetical protein
LDSKSIPHHLGNLDFEDRNYQKNPSPLINNLLTEPQKAATALIIAMAMKARMILYSTALAPKPS